MVLESEDISQEAEKVSGPQNKMKRGMTNDGSEKITNRGRQAIRHQPADVIAVHEYRDQYSQALEGSSSYDDWNGLVWGLRC